MNMHKPAHPGEVLREMAARWNTLADLLGFKGISP